MTDDLINVYKKSKKLMPLVHLPVQSGSDKVLELMNRKHTIRKYLEIYYKLKEINSSVQFSSDFIIAYPGENENDFNDTLKLIKKVKFINSFSFIFSPRPGTVAENLPIIDKKDSFKRLELVQKILFDNQTKMNKSLEKMTLNVLVENRTDNKAKLFGRSEYMTSVLFNGSDDLIGKIVKVKIMSSNRNTLFGELVNQSKQKVA
jgi:tRNA-2-methylthio-N6-dimethylallyladenosine synthase